MNSRVFLVLIVHKVAAAAKFAITARASEKADADPLADLPTTNAGSHPVNSPDDLVAGNTRISNARETSLDCRGVRVANTARLDANAYLVVAGILKRPPRFSELSWSPYLDAFVSVCLPFALPYVFTGMKVAATLVFMGVIVGEFISADAGLGYFNLNAGARSNTPGMFAGLVALSLLGLAFYGMIVLAERAVQRWWRG